METQDKAPETKDEVKTNTQQPTPEAKEPSPTYTKAQLDKAIEDALKREGGRINKSLEQRVAELEAETKRYKEQAVITTASKYGIPEDKVRELGFDSPETIEKIASIFRPQETEKPFRVDSGVNKGNISGSVDKLREQYAQGKIPLSVYEKGMRDAGLSP